MNKFMGWLAGLMLAVAFSVYFQFPIWLVFVLGWSLGALGMLIGEAANR